MAQGGSGSARGSGTLLISLGALVPLGSREKRDRFWCDLRTGGFDALGHGPLWLSSSESVACADWADVTWTGEHSLRSGH
jgi:hypothetical protein